METTKKSITNHEQKHKKVHKCNECSKLYTRKGHTRCHQLITHGGKHFMCPYCKLSFMRVTNMSHHIEMNRRCKRADEAYFNKVMGLSFNTPPTLVPPTAGPSIRDDYVPRVVEGHHVHPLHRSMEKRGGTGAWPVPPTCEVNGGINK